MRVRKLVIVRSLIWFDLIVVLNNKSAQSNLGRGPRRGAVAHVRRKVPIGYNGAPQIRPKVPLPVDRYPNRTTCLIPGPVRPTMPNDIRIRSAVFSTMHWTARPTVRRTYIRTDRQIVQGKVWRLYAAALRDWHGLIILMLALWMQEVVQLGAGGRG